MIKHLSNTIKMFIAKIHFEESDILHTRATHHLNNIIIFPRNVSFREYYVYITEKHKFSGIFSSATQPLPRRGPPRHNFVFSAITFEGFKLRSSNLTHALLIQISRTSSIIDIVVPSKMASGCHFVKKKVEYRSEMARNAIKSYLRTSKMVAGGHLVKN